MPSQGAGESGKSTVFRQMRILHGKGFSPAYRREKVNVVRGNVITAMQTLVEAAEELEQEVTAKEEADMVMDLTSDDGDFSDKLAAAIEKLWLDPGIKTAYDQRSRFQVPDSAEYFITKASEIAKPDYVPSEEDIIRVRWNSTLSRLLHKLMVDWLSLLA